jgi:hypothetical protein
MKAWGRAAIWGLALAALTLPASAAGSAPRRPSLPRFEVQRANTEGFIYLGKADGYQLAISLPNRRVAILSATLSNESDPNPSITSSTYAVHARASLDHGSLRAKFGSLGSVSLRFRPQGSPHVGQGRKGCEGRRPVTEFGTYRGRVSLAGEGGYFQLSSTRAKGVRKRSFRLRCKRGRALPLGEVAPLRTYVYSHPWYFVNLNYAAISLLYATGRLDGRLLWLRAVHYTGDPPGAEVAVGTLEARHGVSIGRIGLVGGGAGTLSTTPPGVHPAIATLAPPAPFHGEASFLENSSTSHSWTGTLGIALPGLDLPLTDPELLTSLCVLSPLRSPKGCDFAKPKPLLPARLTTPPALRRWLRR